VWLSSDVGLNFIQQGCIARTAGKTEKHSASSRSHAVLQILLRTPGKGIHGKLSLVDLAGNETGEYLSSTDKQAIREHNEINNSLLVQKECIRNVGNKCGHVSFRSSTLTYMLQDSLIPEYSKLSFIAMISPGKESYAQTLNTMRFADCMKELKANYPMETSKAVSSESESMEVGERGAGSPATLSCLASDAPGSMDTRQGIQPSAVRLPVQPELGDEELALRVLKNWRDLDPVLDLRNDVGYNRSQFFERLEGVLQRRIRILTKIKSEVAEVREKLARD
jgi:kinesin family protein 2/24